MGHYDLNRDRDGPSEYELRQRRQAYETKQNAIERDQISDDEVREFLHELNECREADGLACNGSSYCAANQHAKDVLCSDEEFDAAQTLVENGSIDSVYDALGNDRQIKQLVQMCHDATLTTMGVRGRCLTDDGHQVMLGDNFDRPELSWDEDKAQSYRKHE